MEKNKHFEPVTARSLAEQIKKAFGQLYYLTKEEVKINTIHSIIEPHIRKPSDHIYFGSVPKKCEEAYDEAVRIIKNFVDTFECAFISDTNSRKAEEFLKKPNPFKEVDIVDNGKPEPQLLPFDLGLAAQGHKVVTGDGRGAKVVAEGLAGDWSVLATYIDILGIKRFGEFNSRGQRKGMPDGSLDLFILKEPETIEIRILESESGVYSVINTDDGYAANSGDKLIKTITTTI